MAKETVKKSNQGEKCDMDYILRKMVQGIKGNQKLLHRTLKTFKKQ